MRACPAIAMASSVERGEVPDLERDLVRGHVDGADARRHGGGHEEGAAQRRGADEQVPTDHADLAQCPRMGHERDLVHAHGASDPDGVHRRRAPLCEDRGQGRSTDAETEAEDQPGLEREVERGGADGDVERGARVLEAAQVAGTRQHEQHGRHPEQADAKVDERLDADLARGTEQSHERSREHQSDRRDDDADQNREPHSLDRLVRGLSFVAGSDETSHGSGRPVGQEDEDRIDDQQDAAGNREARERVGPEVSDDRGVGEDVERLGDQSPERGNRQADDFAVVTMRTHRVAPGRHITSWRLSLHVA